MSTPQEGSRRNSQAWKKLRAQVIRDEDDCYICLEPVDKSIKWPDPECAVADHILAVVNGGEDIRENLSLAHNACNLAKGRKRADEVREMNYSRVW